MLPDNFSKVKFKGKGERISASGGAGEFKKKTT